MGGSKLELSCLANEPSYYDPTQMAGLVDSLIIVDYSRVKPSSKRVELASNCSQRSEEKGSAVALLCSFFQNLLGV